MQILARYIAEAFFKNLMMALLGLTGLFFFQSVITQLNDFALNQLLIYCYYDIPKMIVMVAPPAALMATVLTLSGLSKTNELIACYSIGISIQQIMSIIIPIVFVMCCASLVIQDRILPAFHEKKTLFYWREIKQKQDFYLDVKQDKIWYRSNNLIYNLRTFDPKTDQISGIGVYVFSDQFELQELLQAETATYNGKTWELKNGKTTKFDEKTGFPLVEDFKARELKIKEGPSDFKMIEQEVDRLRIKELIRFIDTNKRSGIDSKTFEVKLHSRFSMSFIPIVMALLAVPFSISRSREGRLGRDLMIAFGITLVYWIGYSITLSLGQKGTVPPIVAAWLPTMVFGALALILQKGCIARMAKLKIYTFPDLVLAKKAKPIERVEKSYFKIADDMLETMYFAPGIGLAANQVGLLERMIVVDTDYVLEDIPEGQKPPESAEVITVDGEKQIITGRNPLILINPEIIYKEGTFSMKEGCLSVPEYTAEVNRADKIKVQFNSIDGLQKTIDAEGVFSVCLQHEMDHLEGTLFIDRLNQLKREFAKKKLIRNRREREEGES